MANKTKYLSFYKKYAKIGTLPSDGLCTCFDSYRDIRELFKPDNVNSWTYWASEEDGYSNNRYYDFNPLRQNIVLLLAAINNEL
jgi:hypothetical protein